MSKIGQVLRELLEERVLIRRYLQEFGAAVFEAKDIACRVEHLVEEPGKESYFLVAYDSDGGSAIVCRVLIDRCGGRPCELRVGPDDGDQDVLYPADLDDLDKKLAILARTAAGLPLRE